jgi:hypothetical protein
LRRAGVEDLDVVDFDGPAAGDLQRASAIFAVGVGTRTADLQVAAVMVD